MFKHGIHNNPDDKIDISITAADGMIKCHTSNTILPPDNRPPMSSVGGIGMQNLRRRLQLLYGDKAILAINITDSHYVVDLSIPIYDPSTLKSSLTNTPDTEQGA